MSLRAPGALAIALLLLTAPAASAQESYSPPPMVPVDEAPADEQPWGDPNAQPAYPEQPPPEHPQYTNPPIDGAGAQQPEGDTTFAGTGLASTRSKHFLALASVGFGLFAPGLHLNARAEADIGKLALLASYTGFGSDVWGTTDMVGHFMGMGGWSIFSREDITLRVLGGVDVIDTGAMVAVGPVFGSTVRAMFGGIGLDVAAFFTPFPFRQLEVRAAFVVRWWSIFEAHLGWRYQAIDPTQGNTLGALFTSSPTINGPVIGLGLTF